MKVKIKKGDEEMSKRVVSSLLVAVFLIVAFASVVSAQDYPERPIEFIVPWSPGGGSDTLMRLVASHLEEYIGVPVPVINKPGGSGTLALREFRDANPNGYNISQIHEGLLAAYHVGITDINYDDFLPVAAMTSSPQYLAIRKDAPYTNVEEFVEFAVNNPDEVRMGVTLQGIPHVWAAILENNLDTSFRYVSYEGTGERVQALAGGFIDAAMIDYASGVQFVENGDFDFIAFASEERSQTMPDVPTMMEKGYDMVWTVQRGVVLPKGTPEEIVEVLEEALEQVANDPDYVEAVEKTGSEVIYRGQEQYLEYLEKLDNDIAEVAEDIK